MAQGKERKALLPRLPWWRAARKTVLSPIPNALGRSHPQKGPESQQAAGTDEAQPEAQDTYEIHAPPG